MSISLLHSLSFSLISTCLEAKLLLHPFPPIQKPPIFLCLIAKLGRRGKSARDYIPPLDQKQLQILLPSSYGL